MIEIDQLKFRYPRSDFRLQIEKLSLGERCLGERGTGEGGIGEGQVEKIAVVGPSGSGKTTLLNLIAGIVAPSSGTIRVSDQEVTSLSDAQRRDFRAANIGMVFQRFELIEYLTVLDNVLLPFAINQSLGELRPRQEVVEQATKLIDSVGLASKLRRRPNQLSQGEQQRVAICRALVTNPQLILADEPTGNLDPKNKRLIIDLIFQQAEARNQTLIVVTHDQGILDGFDRVIDFDQFYVDDTEDLQPAGGEVSS